MRWIGLVLVAGLLAGCEQRGQSGGVVARSTAAPATVEERETYLATFGVLVAADGGAGDPLYAAATIGNTWGRLDSFTSGGTGRDYPFEVNVTPYAKGPRGTITPISGMDTGLAGRIARDVASADEAVRFAVAVSGATFCRGGAVSLNTGVGRKISAPGEMAAVLGASTAAGRDVIPFSVRGTSIPAVERLATSTGPSLGSRVTNAPGWVVRLRCSLWRG